MFMNKNGGARIYINKLLFCVTYNYICIYLFTHFYDPGDFNKILYHDSDLFYFGKLHNFHSRK